MLSRRFTLMRSQLRRTGLLLAIVQLISLGCANALNAAETLYNGIVLPDEWPPRIDKLSREPMPVPYLEDRPAIIPIDVGRQLFVDDFLIEATSLTRTYHAARYHPDCPVLKPDRKWENDSMKGKPRKATAIVFGGGVWHDPTDGLFKMWYMGSNLKRTCYATSRDGIRWEKPLLDIVPGTNVLLDQERDSDTVWLDLNEKDPARRYKMFTTVPRPEGDGFKPAIYYSADGIHWGKPLIIGGGIGDRTTIFYNPFRRRWVYSIRSLIEPWGRSRRYAECTDLVEGMRNLGQNAVLWLTADRLDPSNPHPCGEEAGPQLYNLDVVPYESLMVGLFSIWQGKSAEGAEKRNEILVGYTRDGFHWHRPWRKPFVAVNETDGAWNWANVQSCASGCLVMGDLLYFYVSGRGRSGEPASTGLALLRRDGFASMDASGKTGTLTTRPVVFSGKYLFVNANAAGGELRVEVLNRDGKVVPGLGGDRCVPVTADGTLQPVQWMNSRDLAAVVGKPVRFRFHLRGGELYSFWVSPEKSGASNGYVAAGGPGFVSPKDTIGIRAYQAAAIAAHSTTAVSTSQPVPPDSGSLTVAPVAPQNPRNSEAAIIQRKDGSLLLAWTEFYAGSGADHGPARIVGRISNDDGQTWSTKYTLVENDGGCNVMEVNFLRLKDGNIALFHCQKNTENADCRVMMRVSSDEGRTWGLAKQLSPPGKYTGLTNGRCIRLKTGRILLEAWEGGFSYCYISDDDGKTWRESQRVKPRDGCWEPACIELKDGRVMMLMRTGMGGQYKSISKDGGATWSDPLPTPLVGTAAPVSISRVPKTGDLLAIWNHNLGAKKRNPLTAILSKDEGETWQYLRNIEDAPGDAWAYPAVTWVKDHALLTYFNYTGGLSLKLRILPTAWFYK